jgi:hypothetical protein
MVKKVIEFMDETANANKKELRRFTYSDTNKYLLREYGYDLEYFLNCALNWVWDEMYWGIDMSEEEGEEDE